MANSSVVIAGDTILATDYNELRDDAIHLTTGHKHTGAASEAPLLNDSGASPPSAGQEGFLFHDTDDNAITRDDGAVFQDFIAVDPVVGVGGLRTLGTGAQQAAVGSHGHTFSEDDDNGNSPATSGSGNVTRVGPISNGASTDVTTSVTAAGQPFVIAIASWSRMGTQDAADKIECLIEGVIQATDTGAGRRTARGTKDTGTGSITCIARAHNEGVATDVDELLINAVAVSI